MIMVKVVTLNAGYPSEQDKVRGLGWKVGDEFEVEVLEMGGCHTDVLLRGVEGWFNSVFFDFYENGNKLDIYSDARFNKYLKTFCKDGI